MLFGDSREFPPLRLHGRTDRNRLNWSFAMQMLFSRLPRLWLLPLLEPGFGTTCDPFQTDRGVGNGMWLHG